ncbi:hypothetical protein [Paenibacillus sp. Y412MC10]|uniref:hypothetical protein n=1 Tax=Geobacillus sp. (strain Y412MC10) TaxID=481743 RepID=UPI0011A56031|nr:hypothetical protein [Paenibacillus sp. Y412MC10]
MKSFVKNSGRITMMLFIACSVGCSASEQSNPRTPEEIATKEAVESMNMNPQADSGTDELSQAGERYGSNIMYSIKMYLERPEVSQAFRNQLAETIELGYDLYRKKDIPEFESLVVHIKQDNRSEVKEIYEKLITIYPLPTRTIRGASFNSAKDETVKAVESYF